MPKKTVAVECPRCNKRFTVQIDTKYKSAEAIPEDSHLLEDEGEYLPCPNCPRQLFYSLANIGFDAFNYDIARQLTEMEPTVEQKELAELSPIAYLMR